MQEERITVFLSRPNPFLKEQELFLERLKRMLDELGIRTITLQADNYDLSDSMNYLKGMIRRCYGIIVVAFKQYYIDKGFKKKGGSENPAYFYPQEIDVSGQALTSPYCQIEGTIGILNDLPLLVMNEKGIREEGILQGGRFCTKTDPFVLTNLETFFSDETVHRKIHIWAGKVFDYYLFLNLRKG
jgi:hypothetical protein